MTAALPILDDDDDTCVSPEQQALRERIAERQLKILAIRARDLAARVSCGDIAKIDAVDMAHTAAIAAGVVDLVGDDAVQAVLAAAFGEAPWQTS
jgi:hypothetical protein